MVQMKVFSTELLIPLFFHHILRGSYLLFCQWHNSSVLILLFFLLKIVGKLHETSGAPSAASLLNYLPGIFNCCSMKDGNSFRGVYVRYKPHINL